MTADREGLVSGQHGEAWHRESQSAEEHTQRADNSEFHRETAANNAGSTRSEIRLHQPRRTPGRPHRSPRDFSGQRRSRRPDHRAAFPPNGARQASHPEAHERGFAARSVARAVQAMRSPHLVNIGFLILLYAISLQTCFDLASVVSRSFVCLGAKAAFVAMVDLVVNELIPSIQTFLAGRLVRWIGLSILLALFPALTVMRLGLLAKLRWLAASVLTRLRGTHTTSPRTHSARRRPSSAGNDA
jgi:hypothetical protein